MGELKGFEFNLKAELDRIDAMKKEAEDVSDLHRMARNFSRELPTVLVTLIEEIHRNAAAYGWEIAQGAPWTQEQMPLSDDNPFADVNWAKHIIVAEMEQGLKVIDHEQTYLLCRFDGTILWCIHAGGCTMKTVFTMDVVKEREDDIPAMLGNVEPIGTWTMTVPDFDYTLRRGDPVHIGDICFYVKHVWPMLSNKTHPDPYIHVDLKTAVLHPTLTPNIDSVWWNIHFTWYEKQELVDYLQEHGFTKWLLPEASFPVEPVKKETTTFDRYINQLEDDDE